MPAIDSSALRSTSEVSFSVQPPLSLYVHIPWCVRKCPYCDFNSHEVRAAGDKDRHVRALEPQLEAQYVEALLRDLESALPQIWGRRVLSVFFGGGTPSLLSASALDQILSGIRARVQLDPSAEVTLEANPGTFEAQKFAEFRALVHLAGVPASGACPAAAMLSARGVSGVIADLGGRFAGSWMFFAKPSQASSRTNS